MHVTSRLALGALCAMSLAIAEGTDKQLPESVVSFERPVFPATLKATSTLDGYATVAFVIRADGQVDDAVVLEASHVAFGESVLDVLPSWRFEPTPADTLPRREVLRFEFEEKGVVTSLSHRDATKAAFPLTARQRMPIRTVSWAQLTVPPERPPERLATLTPTLQSPSVSGKVAVSYIIDTFGRVRVPVVVNATRPDLGLAALAAVKQWRFAPPTHEDTPVLVEDVRSFTFGKIN